MSELSNISWLNGRLVSQEEAKSSSAGHTLQYGVGIFDGLMAYWNEDHYHLFFITAHLERFIVSCHKLGLRLEWPISEIEAGIRDLLSNLPSTDYYIRPIAFRSKPQVALTSRADE